MFSQMALVGLLGPTIDVNLPILEKTVNIGIGIS